MTEEINVGALADFASHRIEGFVDGHGIVSTPLFSQIDGNLWMGGCPVVALPMEFQFVLNLYPWGEYETRAHQVSTSAWLFDQAELPDERLLHALAAHVNECRAVGPTLVHCQAGLNRSGLVTALALMKAGRSSKDAIELLREKRCDAVLCNTAFRMWLCKQDAPAPGAAP
jgi:protein-tyrosine phosphatase